MSEKELRDALRDSADFVQQEMNRRGGAAVAEPPAGKNPAEPWEQIIERQKTRKENGKGEGIEP